MDAFFQAVREGQDAAREEAREAAEAARGEELLHEAAALLGGAEAEDAECRAFLAWVEGTRGRGERRRTLVRQTGGDVEVPLPGARGLPGASVAVLDFAPRSGRGDDAIYAENRDVWEELPRGCAMLRVRWDGGGERLAWAVRANRKFTGHEDEAAGSVALYAVEGAPPPERAVVTVKENGKVLHMAARRLEGLAPGAAPVTLAVLGSKKVHVAVPWRPADGAAALAARVDAAYGGAGVRYELVRAMAAPAGRCLAAARLFGLLASARLVINAELLAPGGEHPVSNRALHGIEEDEAFCFSLTVSARRAPLPGLELGVPPLAGLAVLRRAGLRTVRHAVIDARGDAGAARVARARDLVAALPEAEGAVLYHTAGEAGAASRLEKVKAAGYVIKRAVREKAKSTLGARRGRPGALAEARAARDDAAAARLEDGREVELPALSAAAAPRLRELGGAALSATRWRFPAGAAAGDDAALLRAVREAYTAGRLSTLRAGPLRRAQDAAERRVREIDHVRVEGRERWVALARGFFAWALDRAAAGELADASELVAGFSDHWAEYAAGAAAAAAAGQ